MIRTAASIILLAIVLLTVVTLFAQSSNRSRATDAQKIAEALRAGPAFITKDATLLDWPSARGGGYRLLRKGSNQWTCLPAIRAYPHDAADSGFKEEPGCYDPVFLRAMQDRTALPAARRTSIGLASRTCISAPGGRRKVVQAMTTMLVRT